MRLAAASLLWLGRAAAQGYVQEDSYVGEDFFSKWIFYDSHDPTHGFVDYVDYGTAASKGLVNASSSRVYIGSGSHGSDAERGRKSVRLHSNTVYNHGLFIVSLDHIPTGCGTWPALWLLGEDEEHVWPKWGEYDIIEGVHSQDRVMTGLHTSEGCHQSVVSEGSDFSASWSPGTEKAHADDCFVGSQGQFENQGCSQTGPPNSLGPFFNANGGGTYAAEWDPVAGHMRAWFWPAGKEPEDIVHGTPFPETWGMPYSYFRLSPDNCHSNHFQNMRLIFDLTFCGDLGDATFGERCPELGKKMTCSEFVANHPELMSEAYWSIRRLDTYTRQGAVPSKPLPPMPNPEAPGKGDLPAWAGRPADQVSPVQSQPFLHRTAGPASYTQPSSGMSAGQVSLIFMLISAVLVAVAFFARPHLPPGLSAIYRSFAESAIFERLSKVVLRVMKVLGFLYTGAVSLWERLAPEQLKQASHHAWEAVSALDCADEPGPDELQAGDEVRAKARILAKILSDYSGFGFGRARGTVIEEGTQGTVEAMEESGARVAFSKDGQPLGKFQVTESQLVNLEVVERRAAPTTRWGKLRSRSAAWLGKHWRCAFATGVVVLTIVMVLFLIPAHHDDLRSDGMCAAEYQDCRTTRSCCNPTHACFEKDAGWAACLPTCKPGVHEGEEERFQTPWSCRVLEAAYPSEGFRKLMKPTNVVTD